MIQCGKGCHTGRNGVLLGERTHSRWSVVGGSERSYRGSEQMEQESARQRRDGKGRDSQAEEGKPSHLRGWNLGNQVGARQGRAPHGAWTTAVWR